MAKQKKKEIVELSTADIVAKVAAQSEYTNAAVKDVISSFLANLRAEVVAGNTVTLHKIGKFVTVTRAGRAGRNPLTGESIQIPASNGVKFKMSTTVKNEANGK